MAGLSLRRHVGESVWIGDIEVYVADIQGKIVQLSIVAPANVPIRRVKDAVIKRELLGEAPE